MAEKRQDFTPKKKERQNYSIKNAILDWHVYLIDFFRLIIEKVKNMLSQFASISKNLSL